MYLYNIYTQLIYTMINGEAVSTHLVPHFHSSYTHEHTWINVHTHTYTYAGRT